MRLFLILLLSPVLSFAQLENFSIDNNNVVWQKVFNDSTSTDHLTKQLKLSGKFINVQNLNNDIEFDFEYTRDDFKIYGYTYMRGAFFISNGGVCKGIIEFKDNKYRVTITRIIVKELKPHFNEAPLSEYAVKKNQFRTEKAITESLIYFDKYFIYLFTPKNTDW